MASATALCRAPGSLLEGGRESLSSRKSFSSPLPPLSCDAGKHRSSRQHLLLITAQDDSFMKKGTRMFNLGGKGKKELPETAREESSGTRIFRFGSKKQSSPVEEEEEEAPKFGTKLFSFGSYKESGTTKGTALVPQQKASISLPFSMPRRQDPRTVFVAGATGQIGARIAQRLLREGFSVRGGVRDLFIAQQLAEFATQYGVVSREEAKRLNAVEFDFKNVESIAKAIGSAAKVVVTIGPTEDGPKSKVAFQDASNVIEAAKLANVSSLVIVYEPGTAPAGDNPLTGLTSFFSELFSKPVAVSLSELITEIVDSDISYTFLKTSSSEGVDDLSFSLQNIELRKEGSVVSLDSSKISKSQIALVVSEVLMNSDAAANKVIEVLTSASAAAKPISELLSAIPTDGRREALAAAKLKAEEEEREKQTREQVEMEARTAVEEARRAAQLAAKLEAEAKEVAAEEARAGSLAEKAQAQAAAAAASVDGLASKIKELGPDLFSKAKSVARPSLGFSLPAFSPPSSSASPPKTPPKPAAAKPKKAPPPPKRRAREPTPAVAAVGGSAPAPKTQSNRIFGGLFTQETVYIDE